MGPSMPIWALLVPGYVVSELKRTLVFVRRSPFFLLNVETIMGPENNNGSKWRNFSFLVGYLGPEAVALFSYGGRVSRGTNVPHPNSNTIGGLDQLFFQRPRAKHIKS